MSNSAQEEEAIRQAVKGAAVRVGIMEVCRVTGLARWTVRRLIRDQAVHPGTIHQVAAKLSLLEEGSK